ncbi:MAG: asparagine synthetase B, partial [Gammaproteobacteria bacterium]|nr:asparagine synthetase B [Gammaproteobacteria bacterium]
MCGIAGIVLREGTVAPERLEGFCRRLGHRGPDDAGFHLDGPAGIAHTRLSVIDLAGGRQPLIADGGRLVLAANGEIYNHVELRAELEARGHRFTTRSDCETILHAYRAYGDDFIGRLHGMFAFALWDAD